MTLSRAFTGAIAKSRAYMESASFKEDECRPSNLRCSLGISHFAAHDRAVVRREWADNARSSHFSTPRRISVTSLQLIGLTSQ